MSGRKYYCLLMKYIYIYIQKSRRLLSPIRKVESRCVMKKANGSTNLQARPITIRTVHGFFKSSKQTKSQIYHWHFMFTYYPGLVFCKIIRKKVIIHKLLTFNSSDQPGSGIMSLIMTWCWKPGETDALTSAPHTGVRVVLSGVSLRKAASIKPHTIQRDAQAICRTPRTSTLLWLKMKYLCRAISGY